MANLTPDQRRRRERVEAVIRLAEPVLNLVLTAGERLSRAVEREDTDYYPPRSSSIPPPPPTIATVGTGGPGGDDTPRPSG